MVKHLSILVTILGATAVLGQNISPVWLQHYNLEPDQILHPVVKQSPVGDSLANGQSVMTSYAGIRRYDENRILVGLRENGINENDPATTPEMLAIAEQYPDRSLIWLDADTGAYLGVAHRFDLRPWPMEPEWTDAGGSLDYLYWSWALDDGPPGGRALYTLYNNKISRYAPDGAGGWVDTPTLAFEEPTPGSAAAAEAAAEGIPLTDAGPWQQWRAAILRVGGTGEDTWLYISNKTWRNGQHDQLLHTDDGLSFFPVARLNDRDGARKGGTAGGGGPTRPIRYGQDPERPNLLTVFEGHYPATGFGLPITRFTWDPDDPTLEIESNRENFGGPWGTSHPFRDEGNRPYREFDPEMQVGFFNPSREAAGDFPAFQWDQGPENHEGEEYDGFWSQALEGHEELDYIVSFSSPSWNTGTDSFRPAWIAVHSIEGDRTRDSEGNYTAHQIPVTGADQPEQADPPRNPFMAVYGDLEVYPDAEVPGKAEVLWVGRTYGFGRFTVESIPASLIRNPQNITVLENRPFQISAEFSGGVNRYQWLKDGEPVSGATRAAYDVALASLDHAGEYNLLARNALGNVESAAATVTVLPDLDPPVALSAGSLEPDFFGTTWVGIRFDEMLDEATASDPANYVFADGQQVFTAELSADARTVFLQVAPGVDDEFVINLRAIQDLAGNAMAEDTPVVGRTSGMTGVDIGEFQTAGSASAAIDLNSFDVRSDGADIWGASDNFHYIHREQTGDFDVAVRIDFSQSNNNWARNSIMLRELDWPASHHVSVGATPIHPERGFYAHFRGPDNPGETQWWNNDGTPHGPAFNGPVPYTEFPIWLRLVRTGNAFTAYRSVDGANWLHFGDLTVEMSQTALLGLATSQISFTRYAEFGDPELAQVPGPLSAALTDGVVVITWDGAGTLQSASDVTGPWENVPAASSPHSVAPDGNQAFFRLAP